MSVVRIKLEDLLLKMKGKSYLYKTNQITILTFEFKGKDCIVATDEKVFVESVETMLDILQTEFKPLYERDIDMEQASLVPQVKPSAPATPAKPARIVRTAESVKLFPKLTAALLDNIDRIKADKGYCEQAQQVSLSVKMFVDLARTELESLRISEEFVEQ